MSNEVSEIKRFKIASVDCLTVPHLLAWLEANMTPTRRSHPAIEYRLVDMVSVDDLKKALGVE